MTKKRSIKSRKRDSSRRHPESLELDMQEMMDKLNLQTVEELNAFMSAMMSSNVPIPHRDLDTPLKQAQELCYEAWEMVSDKKRIKLVHQALELSEDCADAYLILALSTCTTPEEAKPLLEKAVEAGERALGERFFRKEVGYFWQLLETRPYMRAKQDLAFCLWELDEQKAAIGHLQDMIRLNPRDDQLVRFTLLNWLQWVQDTKAIYRLLKRYSHEPTIPWLYGWALYQFMTKGASLEAEDFFLDAIEANPYVVGYLLGMNAIPDLHSIDYDDQTLQTEAQVYSLSNVELWNSISGAIEWLEACISKYDDLLNII